MKRMAISSGREGATVTGSETHALKDWTAAFSAAFNAADADGVAALFADGESYWRDLVSVSWNIVTVEGRGGVAGLVRAQAAQVGPITIGVVTLVSATDAQIEGWFDFTTRDLRGRGYVRLRDGACWTLLTAAQALTEFEEPTGRSRIEGAVHKATKARRTWTDEREATAATLGHSVQPYCLIIGGGQGGLALGVRLKQLDVPTLIVDALERPGDSWRSRYKSLCLHDPVWIDHLPYMPFPAHWPVYTPKDKMGDWLEAYAKVMELDIWSSTICRKASYDAQARRWTVIVERGGETITLHPSQFVLATGLSGIKTVPAIPGAETFQGTQFHSSDHPGGAAFAGKRCVVIGANNSAHDIAADLWENGADVTMIQRSPTTVIKATALRRLQDAGYYSEQAVEAGLSTDDADLLANSMPFRAREPQDQRTCLAIQDADAPFYDRLRARGFLLDFDKDDTGIAGKYPRRASGYYIDVGASDLIADGEIKLCSGVGVAGIEGNAVILSSGERLPADVIVYATGYGPMNGWAEMLISKEVADRIGPCWGLGSDTPMDPGPWEGELRNMWKPTAQEGLWFHGGNLAQSRFHSLHLALQLKARMEGIATPVFHAPTIERAPLKPARALETTA
ncbi:NAD(P)/FAD-dependent oxidoreductase [soil metagenome]